MLAIYKFLSVLLLPFLPFLLKKRVKKGKEDPTRYTEKLGKDYKPFNNEGKKVIWFFAASVGESLSVLPLINKLCEDGCKVVLSTGTLTSANLLGQKLPQGAVHVFNPVDNPVIIKRFLNHFKPDTFVLVEEEFWPNLVQMATKYCKKSYFLNAKFSEKSAAKWLKYKKVFIFLLKCFDKNIMASSTATEKMLESIGVACQPITSLKYYTINSFQPQNPVLNVAEGVNLDAKNTILALSTHAGEEDIVLSAFVQARKKLAKTFLFLMPRHPHRLADVIASVKKTGLKYALMSANDVIDEETAILIADKLGLVANFLLISKVVFVAGSLVDGIGGHNILEPACFGKPTITGPYNENFENIVSNMVNDGAIVKLKPASPEQMSDELSMKFVTIFQNTTLYKELGKNAKNHVDKRMQDLNKICNQINSH